MGLQTQLEKSFADKCEGQVNCSFPLNYTMIPQTCKDGLALSDVTFIMRVGCKSDEIMVFGAAPLKKETVAMIVVFSDLFISIFLFVMFAFLRSM
jgi:hypothetical protein